mmetsp:Transcript_24332/g.75114  ORF Transcript_24332/g.75114 Transcript_24332/m.75114 type:complete len:425 (-) Transcript_24332:155-1429(-)
MDFEEEDEKGSVQIAIRSRRTGRPEVVFGERGGDACVGEEKGATEEGGDSTTTTRQPKSWSLGLEDVDALEVFHGLSEALDGGFFGGAEGHAGVVVLFVGFVGAVGVADLLLEVVVVLGLVLADAVPEGPLGVGVDVHLDGARFDGVADFFLRGAGAAVEDEVDGFFVVAAQLLGDELLGVVENDGFEFDVARRVDAVDVAEGGGDGELAVRDLGKGFVDLPHFFGLRVELRRVHARVVHAVLFAARDAELHFQQEIDLRHPFEILDARLDVVLQRILRQVEHVRREQRFSVRLEVLLVLLQQPVEPRQPVPHAVVRVQNHRHSVQLGQLSHLQRARHAPRHRRLVHQVPRRHRLPRHELPAATAELDDHGSAELGGGLEARVDAAGGDGVDGGDGEAGVLGVREKIHQSLSGDDPRLHCGRQF